MTWEKVTYYISIFMNKPVVIAVTTILTLLGSILAIISKTSFGKKAIASLRTVSRKTSEKADTALKIATDAELFVKEKVAAIEAYYEQKTESLKQTYEQKAAALISIVNFYEETLFSALEKIPNAKVQSELAALKEKYVAKKEEITEVVGVIYQDYTETIESVRAETRAEYDEKINYIENELKKLSLYFNEIKEVEPNGEESENTDPTQKILQENQ